jgi:acetyl-CoA carboxylase biotin carboxyl carrier protein
VELSQDEVLQILKIIDESHFNELSLEIGDLKLIVGKGGARKIAHQMFDQSTMSSNRQNHSKAVIIGEQGGDTQHSDEEDSKEIGSDRSISFGKEGCKVIKAPMLGTFYRSPQPGAPPFVDIGSSVNENDTICIIEVMKCMNSVKSGVSGEIVKCMVEDGKLVEYQQELFIVNPKPDSQS